LLSKLGTAVAIAMQPSFWRNVIGPVKPFGSAFAKYFARLFADFGASFFSTAPTPELDQIASPLYKRVIEHSGEMTQASARDQELSAAAITSRSGSQARRCRS
jgi:hypothetical protein